MKFSRSEKAMIFGVSVAWIQLMFGYWQHAIFGMLVFILIALMGLIEYQRMR